MLQPNQVVLFSVSLDDHLLLCVLFHLHNQINSTLQTVRGRFIICLKGDINERKTSVLYQHCTHFDERDVAIRSTTVTTKTAASQENIVHAFAYSIYVLREHEIFWILNEYMTIKSSLFTLYINICLLNLVVTTCSNATCTFAGFIRGGNRMYLSTSYKQTQTSSHITSITNGKYANKQFRKYGVDR